MAAFNYIAKNKDGLEVRSTVEATTRLVALEGLRRKGLTVVDLFSTEGTISQETSAPPRIKPPHEAALKKRKPSLFSAKVNMTDLAIFCRQLAIAVNAGVPLRDAIEGISMELEHVVLKYVCEDIVQQLHDGHSFSAAVESHPQVFNSMFQGLVRVAEESGTLPSTLKQLADYLEKADRLQRRIKAMASYPMFIGIFFIAVCLIMTLFILPKFKDIFGGTGGELPAITSLVFGINEFLVSNVLPIALSVLGISVIIALYIRTPVGAFNADKFKLAIPGAGGCLNKYIMARFCRSLAIMVHSGVPIAKALEICAEATGNLMIRRNVLAARDNIITGNRIAASMEKTGIFPGLVVRMVSVGEDSGQLPEVLDSVSDLYEDQVEVSVMATMALFEPLIICIFGAFILVIVLAIYMPIFSVSSSMH